MNIPTGIEIIHREKLEDQILIEIPKSDFHLHGVRKKNHRWDVSIIDQLGAVRRNVIKDIAAKDLKGLITVILAGKEQTEFKKRPGITKLSRHYKSLIKSHKA